MSRAKLIKEGLKRIGKVPGAVKNIAKAQRAGKTPTGGTGAKGRKFRRDAAKVGAGAAAGAAAVSIPTKKPKSKVQRKAPSVTRDGRGPLRQKPGDRGAGTRDKPLKLSQIMNKKGTVYSGKLGEFMKKRNEPGGGEEAKKRLEKIRANRKGGGMMKKRMKRGGMAKKKRVKAMGGGMMKKRMKRGGRAMKRGGGMMKPKMMGGGMMKKRMKRGGRAK